MTPMDTRDCPHCSAGGQSSLFCTNCERYMPDPSGLTKKVTHNRRFWGDNLLEGVLFLVTLIVGWFIWLAFTAKTSQTPAKRLLDVYVLDVQTGQPISAGRVWVREVLIKWLLLGAVSTITSGIAGFVNSIWVLVDKNRQALHDKVASTIVVYAPSGLPKTLPAPWESLVQRAGSGVKGAAEELRELARLRDEGILTPEEYEAKRKQLAEKM